MRVNTDEAYQESKFNWLILLLALLINLIVLFFLFLVTIDNHFWNRDYNFDKQPEAPVVFEDIATPPEPTPPEPPEPVQPHEIAALKPGASQFGNPDEFKEDEFIAKIPEPDNAVDPLQEINEAQESLAQETEALTPPNTADDETQQTPQNQQQESMPTLQPEQQIVATQQHNITENKPQPSLAPKPTQKIMPQQPPVPPQKIRAPEKKELTFNDLARGFLASLDEGGNDLIERKGNENIRPDFEEMRYLSYLHKIIWYMQNEWRRDTTLAECGSPVMVITGVSITLDKDGNLKKASVIQSCGIHQLDEAIIRGIYAGSPYPPLPSHLKKDILTVEFGVKHIGNQRNNRVNFHFR